jgi:2-iminobutanoate/2-iminopropanoate deaminase
MSDNKQTSGAQQTNQFGPYSLVRRAGQYIFVSGQVGVDPTTGTAQPDITNQTKQVLQNLESALQSAGLDMNTVVKTTVFLTDMHDFEAMNAVYVAFFDAPRPARSTVAVKELPRVGGGVPLRVEIEAIAMIGGDDA